MSFSGQELSVEGGSPVELYDINYVNKSWHYTSSDAEFYDATTTRNYLPAMISRSSIQLSGDIDKNGLNIQIQNDVAFLDLFRTSTPSGVVSVTLRKFHRTDSAMEIVQMWKGRIISVDWGISTSTLICEPIRSSVQRIGLRRIFQRQCPHVLYGTACGVSKALYELLGTVEAISGNTVSVTGVVAFSANYFAGGFAEYINDDIGVTERRMVVANPGGSNQLILLSPTIGLSVGNEVRVYPGCDHTLGNNGCARFNNTINFGGKPYTPTKNPFSGEPIY